MKIFNLLFISISFLTLQSNAQVTVNQFEINNQNVYTTTKIQYPIIGLYQFENSTEPIVQLNADGTGIFQYKDLTKKEITWGLECTKDGFLLFKEGFDSAAYSLWYKTKENLILSDPNEEYIWKKVELSIHFNTKKIYIMGERVKVYVD